jgi:hypothetical protein
MNKPTFSVVIISHEKPKLVMQAIDTAQGQTWPAKEILVLDSGKLLKEIPYQRLEMTTRILFTGETPEIQASLHVPSWVLNQFIPMTQGDWITILCDDDLLLPTYLEAFMLKAPDASEPACLYSGEFRVRADALGCIIQEIGAMHATEERAVGQMDCQVDYLQFCFNRSMWNRLYQDHGGKPFPEEKTFERHADGIFMERAVQIARCQPVPGIHCFNRRTPLSRFCGS